MSTVAPTDADRYPTLTEHGREMLRFLREHPHAPAFRNESGNCLSASEVAGVRAFEREVLAARVGWSAAAYPDWLDGFVARALADVPFYRRYGLHVPPPRFSDLPTTRRSDLSHDIARFVPDTVAIDRLINFRTSGTTGHPLLIASHPTISASYLAFHKRALRHFGLELRHGRGQVGVVLVGHQRKCFTYVSVTPTMDDSGLAKLNLHPNDWRDPADPARYLDALNSEVYTGDPISLAELAKLPLTTRPRALLSTSMALLPGLRSQLEQRFGCPVLDIYSMNEAGPIAVADPTAGGHVLLQPPLFVEILDDTGRVLPAGERGEITLTGGFNSWLPLLRYRTGDYASLRFPDDGSEPVLLGLEGRPPVRFRTMAGEWINNIEVTHVLKRFALPRFALHQTFDASLHLRLLGAHHERAEIKSALLALFGNGQALVLEEADAFGEKVIQYTSDLPGSAP